MSKCCEFVFLAILLSTCGSSSSPPVSTSGQELRSTPKTSPTGWEQPIRNIDFRNFTYDWYPSDYSVPETGKRIILQDGTMKLGVRVGKEPREFFLSEVVYGDLTQDGKEEALVVLGAITSGTSRQFSLLIYTLEANKPKLLWTLQTGDRWDYGLHSAQISENNLVVETYKPTIIEFDGRKHNLSSSASYIRDSYNWNGKNFVKGSTVEVPVARDDKQPWVQHE